MSDDTKMEDAPSGEGGNTENKTTSASTEEDVVPAQKKSKPAENTDAPPMSPLEVAARRLERLLGGGLSEKDRMLDYYTNPAKVVRRWLGTSSGAAAHATPDEIKAAAARLLDPTGPCAAGRALLVVTVPSFAAASSTATTASTEMETDEKGGGVTEEADTNYTGYLSSVSSREVESWLLSLAVRYFWKLGQHPAALEMAQQGINIITGHLQESATRITSSSVVSVSSLFPLLARMFRWRSLVLESVYDPAVAARLWVDMTQAHNLASLRRDVDTQATLLNCMLRALLRNSQVEQAQKLLSNSTFPETASNNQLCRYLYYSGRIQALRLEYSSSYSNLNQCLRKAPTNTALGFRIAAQRLLVVVQLLMGEIPERQVFFTSGMNVELSPYLAITQAVRRGDLAVFNRVVSEHTSRLRTDGTFTLISRLAHQVVKAGLRNLHVSYSRLSLQDVADRLGLPSARSAEYVVAKAVRDGVLDATIHHEEGYVQSHDLVDVYATKEPSEAFHRRIAYCLNTHNDAVRGMRYPPDAHKKQLEESRGNRRKMNDDKTDEEKAKELEDELEEDY